MANFGKFANLSPTGWNEKTLTQTVSVGNNAHIGLFGGGPLPAAEDLDVKSANPTICIVHEEPRPKAFANWRHFLITGLRQGETQVNAFLKGTASAYSAPINVKVVGRTAMRLIFFPGERLQGRTTVGTIYVVGANGEHIAAAGGPPRGGPDRGGHTIEPTPPGLYVLGPKQHIVAPSWPMSVIPWGAALRLNGGEAEYEAASGVWRVATGRRGEVTAAQMGFLKRSGLTPDLGTVTVQVREIFIDASTGILRTTVWERNDFGRWGWNLRSGGAATAYFIHTTPENEHASALGRAVMLANSHGCVHLDPKERDSLMAAHVLQAGISFEVRPYTETGPP
jgi:hypothetical protein